ncbi:MAG TPA: BMP family ABC transporter substrate-binding protein [Clostridia bacterium]|nr:BMP family ABC transporter substrate-binding protein [Clostridia bacterium]
MKKKIIALLVCVALLAALGVGCGSNGNQSGDNGAPAGGESSTETKKYALILGTGGLGDQSFNDLTYEGMKRAEAELGIKFDYVEPKEVADFEIFQNDLASTGEYDLIVCVGFDQVDALAKVAAEYPEQKFALIDAELELPNVVCYVSEEHEGSFLVGALAGLMKLEKADARLNDQNVLGVVGALDIPLIRKFVAGFEAGARYVNPDIEVLYDYVGDFSDPATAKEIALSMNSKGADIIYHAAGGSGLGVFEAAKTNNFLAIGCNSNQNGIAPDVIVASMLKKVDTATYEAVKSAYEGTFKSGIYALGVKDEGIDYTIEGSSVEVPQSIIDKVEELKAQIKSGAIQVPTDIPEVEGFLASQN